MNNKGEYYVPKFLVLWEFKWNTFKSEEYSDDQKFIFVFNNGDEMIIEYDDFIDNQHIKRVGVKYYLPINFGVMK